MKLTQISNGTVVYSVNGTFSLAAGGKLKMEVGEDELDELVPEGKKWTVNVSVRASEEDV